MSAAFAIKHLPVVTVVIMLALDGDQIDADGWLCMKQQGSVSNIKAEENVATHAG